MVKFRTAQTDSSPRRVGTDFLGRTPIPQFRSGFPNYLYWEIMVNATKGLFISCDIPMAQFIINLNAQQPASQKFIIHVLDGTHLFVQPHVAEMIRSAISEFRDKNSYDKPA